MNKQKQLTAFLGEERRAPFSWPGANCCHFAAAWVERVENLDPMAGLPSTPTRAAAVRLQRRFGGLRALVTRQLERDEICIEYAQAGDLVLLQIAEGDPDGWAVGICAGGGLAAFMMDDGATVFLSVLRCACAWRVGQ